MEGMIDESIWKQDKITVPVLAIMAKSPFLPADNEQIYRGIAPDLTYQVWDGAGHFLMMERPAQFNQELMKFLAAADLLKKS
jgi:pimeloyl-ACP methyl ester carboxylesterase